MTELGRKNDSEPDEFDLGEFIEEKSSLFVTMGVFGALAIYISQASPEEVTEASMMIKVGFVAAFLIAMLIFVLIYREMRKKFGSWWGLWRAHTQLRKHPALAAFTLLAALLFTSISSLLAQHEPVLFIFVLLAVFALGYIIVTNVLFWVGKRVPRTPVWRISTVLSVSVVVLLGTMNLRTYVLDQYQLTMVQDLTLSEPMPIVIDITLLLVASMQSMAAIGVLAGLLGIPLVMVDKLRGVSPYDEPG